MLSDCLEILIVSCLLFLWPILNRKECKSFFEYTCIFIWGAVLTFILLRMFVVEFVTGEGRSMQPTLPSSSYLVVDKFHYGIRFPLLNLWPVKLNEPDYGDIVLALSPDKDWVIKRVVATEGDIVEILGPDLIYVNGVKLPVYNNMFEDSKESIYLSNVSMKEVAHKRFKQYKMWKVPPNRVFLVGDNYQLSYDSRDFGPVMDSYIVGKIIAVKTGYSFSLVK